MKCIISGNSFISFICVLVLILCIRNTNCIKLESKSVFDVVTNKDGNLRPKTHSLSLFSNLDKKISINDLDDNIQFLEVKSKSATKLSTEMQKRADRAFIGLKAMIDKLKGNITDPNLRNNLTIENIANFFATYSTGNEVLKELEVQGSTKIKKAQPKTLKAEKTQINKLSFQGLKLNPLKIKKEEIKVDPYAKLKLQGTNIVFHAKELFEVIAFLKYIVKMCGSKLQKCNFSSFLLNSNKVKLLDHGNETQNTTQRNKEEKSLESKLEKSLEDKLLNSNLFDKLEEKMKTSDNMLYAKLNSKIKSDGEKLKQKAKSILLEAENDLKAKINQKLSRKQLHATGKGQKSIYSNFLQTKSVSSNRSKKNEVQSTNLNTIHHLGAGKRKDPAYIKLEEEFNKLLSENSITFDRNDDLSAYMSQTGIFASKSGVLMDKAIDNYYYGN